MSKTFYVLVEMDNAAFDETPHLELSRIFRKLANQLETGPLGEKGNLRDVNGNTVGGWRVEEHQD